MISVEDLTKTFGRRTVVDGVSFSVGKGEVLGFLGPNGAGKSTTMRMITGYLAPSSGRVTVGGFDVATDPIAARRLIGYLPEAAPSYGDMTVLGFLEFAADMRGLRGPARRPAIDRAIDTCFLGAVRHQTIDTLSKGYKHRTCLAQAILHDPDVLVLDEPTDGLDPNQKHEVRELIRRMGASKVIVFSTHILEEVDAVCSRAVIIDRGRIVANGTPAELRQRSALAGVVTLRVAGIPAPDLVGRLSGIAGIERHETVHDAAGVAALRLHPAASSPRGALAQAVGEVARREAWQVEELHTEGGRLDEVFRSITLPDTSRGVRP
jgi:ABC-2 type transport system ATP-binding protein